MVMTMGVRVFVTMVALTLLRHHPVYLLPTGAYYVDPRRADCMSHDVIAYQMRTVRNQRKVTQSLVYVLDGGPGIDQCRQGHISTDPRERIELDKSAHCIPPSICLNSATAPFGAACRSTIIRSASAILDAPPRCIATQELTPSTASTLDAPPERRA